MSQENGSEKLKWWILLLFFPVTVYLFVGTALLFLTYQLGQLTEKLASYALENDNYRPTKWHDYSILLTALFPIAWPIITVVEVVAFVLALFAAILRFFWDAAVAIWREVIAFTLRLWRWVIDSIMATWRWTVESIEYVWGEIKKLFP